MLYHFLVTANKKKNKAEILLLSVAANIVSRHTSMVDVDKDRKEMVVWEMIQHEVPLMTSRGFSPPSFKTYGLAFDGIGSMMVSIMWVILEKP